MALEIFKLLGTVAISKDQALKDIKAIQTQAEKTSTAMGKSFTKFSGYVEKHSAQIKKAGKYMTVFGGIATAAFAVSVKSAANFETQLANVSTMLDESAMKILPEYRKGLQSLSVDFGESTETLSKGLYDILSASIPPAEALGVLEISAKAAAAGITDTGVAADAITTILNSYGMSADQAGMVSDKLFAIVKGGKCLTGDTRILLSDGRYRRIDSLRDEKDLEIVSWDYRNFIPMKAKFVDMGTKQTVKILTGMGREIKTTPEHPYLTPDGWVKVEDLKEEDRIAVPSSLPFFGDIKPKDGWPELLGYLLAEGSIQRGTPRLAIADNRILLKVREAASRYGINLKKINQSDKTKCNSYMLTAGTRYKHHKNQVIEKLREYKLWGTNCHTKFIPDEIFSWQRDDIAKLLNAYFSGDGWLTFDSNNSGKRELGVCSVSKRLLEDVSHLLLRFGINGCLRKNSGNAWIWTTRRYIEIKRFTDYIGIERDSVKQFLEYIPKGRGSYIHLTSYGKIPRKRIKYKPYDGLRNTDNQLYYDKIKEIIYEKEERVYDLIVSKLHNFVANDILAHNTTFAELAPSIGKVAATASMAGLSFDDLGACIATMTRAGIRTEETMTAINGVLIAFLKPTDDAIEAAAKFGLELNTNTLRTEGLTGVMDKLKDATAEQLAAIFPNIRGLKGMAAALGDAEGYARDYALMLDSAGLTQEAFAKQSATLNFKLGQLKEMFNVIKVTIGTALIPAVENLVKRGIEILKKVKEWTEANKPLTETIVKWAAGISLLMLGLGPLLMMLPGLVTAIGGLVKGFGLLQIASGKLAITLGLTSPQLFAVAAAITLVIKATYGWIDAIKESKRIKEAEIQATEAQTNAYQKLADKLGVSVEQIKEWQKEELTVTEMCKRAGYVMKETTKATDENTTATDENTEATDESTEAKIRWLTVSGLVEAEIANLTAQYELSNKTTAETAQYYSDMITKHEELIEKLKEERKSHQEGTVEYQNYTSAIYAAELKIKDLVIATEELREVESKVLTGLELVTAQLGVLENKYSDVAKDEEYFTEKTKLLKQEYEELNAKLKETEFHSQEWFDLTGRLLDNEEAARNLKEEWEELNKVQSDALTGIELVNAELILLEARFENVAKDEDYVTQKTSLLNEKYRLLNQALAETEFHSAEWFELTQNIISVENELGNLDGAIDTSAQRWAEFFTELKNKYSDSIGAIQSGISSFVSTFQGAIETALTSLWHMAETNAEIQQQMAETEQEYIDAKIEMNEEYKQSLIEKLAEYVDAKELANLSIAELETLLKEHSIASYTEMSEANQTKLDELAAKYDEILGEMEGEQVTFESIMKDLWKTLVDAIITELIRLAAFYIVKWLFGLWFEGGGGIGYKLGGEIGKYDLGGRIKKMKQAQARMEYFQRGGPKGTDTIPVWVTPGEYIIAKPMTDFIRRTGAITGDLIRSIQTGSKTPAPAFAAGGLVGAGAVGSVELNILPGAIMINAKTLDGRTIAEAGSKLFAEIEKQARNAGQAFVRR